MRSRRRRLSVRLGVCPSLSLCVCEAVSNRCVSSIFNAFDHSLSPLPTLTHLGSPHPSYPTYPAYPAHSPHAHRDSHSSYLCRLTHKACKDFHNFQVSPGHTAKRRSGRTGQTDGTRKEASPRASAPVRIQLAATVIKAIVP